MVSTFVFLVESSHLQKRDKKTILSKLPPIIVYTSRVTAFYIDTLFIYLFIYLFICIVTRNCNHSILLGICQTSQKLFGLLIKIGIWYTRCLFTLINIWTNYFNKQFDH